MVKHNVLFVDKSLFIQELLQKAPRSVTLIMRPRRFGKTFGLYMLRRFFENDEFQAKKNKAFANMFNNLAISKH